MPASSRLLSQLTLQVGQRHKVRIGTAECAVSTDEDGGLVMFVRVARGESVIVGGAEVRATMASGRDNKLEMRITAPRSTEIGKMKAGDGTPALAPRGVV
jgi:hypothetical protein